MSKWQHTPKFVLQQNEEENTLYEEHIIKRTDSFLSNPYVPTEADLIISRGHKTMKSTEILEEREIWMKHYHFHLKEIYGILIRNLKKFGVCRTFSFDQFQTYAYYSTQVQFVPGAHKRVRILI